VCGQPPRSFFPGRTDRETEKVDLDSVERAALSGAADRRDVSAALGATDVAIMYHELEPGEAFSGGFHAHHDREELFVVLEG